jgi:MYXO-CTERM domain-containing protein
MNLNSCVKVMGCVGIGVAMGSATPALGQVVDNGSMTGPVNIGSPPPGWDSVSTDGDTIGPGGFSGWGTGIGASNDGGTFLALLNNGGGGAFDAAAQVISGFTIGNSYSLNFEYSNIGLDSSAAADYANSGLIRANIAGVNLDSALLAHDGFGSQLWFDFSGSFVATSETMTLTFSAVRSDVGGYAGGVDGVSIIPTPGTFGLFAAAGLAAIRRRR